ncbi:MAG: IS1 family transposase [Desulfobacterales bacterium]
MENRYYVGKKSNQVWIWPCMERQRRALVPGSHSGTVPTKTCRNLWKSLPADYRKRAVCCTDRLESYYSVLPSKRHRASGKESGETSHIERFNCTLRQRCPNLVRKTLSFSHRTEIFTNHIRSFADRIIIRYYRIISMKSPTISFCETE